MKCRVWFGGQGQPLHAPSYTHQSSPLHFIALPRYVYIRKKSVIWPSFVCHALRPSLGASDAFLSTTRVPSVIRRRLLAARFLYDSIVSISCLFSYFVALHSGYYTNIEFDLNLKLNSKHFSYLVGRYVCRYIIQTIWKWLQINSYIDLQVTQIQSKICIYWKVTTLSSFRLIINTFLFRSRSSIKYFTIKTMNLFTGLLT